MKSILTSIATSILLAALAVAQQPPRYSITDLGTLGGSFSLAYGINDNGQIDGFSTLPGDAVQHSFVIEKGAMIDLGTLGGPNSESFANLNNAIQVAGTAETSVDRKSTRLNSSHRCISYA